MNLRLFGKDAILTCFSCLTILKRDPILLISSFSSHSFIYVLTCRFLLHDHTCQRAELNLLATWHEANALYLLWVVFVLNLLQETSEFQSTCQPRWNYMKMLLLTSFDNKTSHLERDYWICQGVCFPLMLCIYSFSDECTSFDNGIVLHYSFM